MKKLIVYIINKILSTYIGGQYYYYNKLLECKEFGYFIKLQQLVGNLELIQKILPHIMYGLEYDFNSETNEFISGKCDYKIKLNDIQHNPWEVIENLVNAMWNEPDKEFMDYYNNK